MGGNMLGMQPVWTITLPLTFRTKQRLLVKVCVVLPSNASTFRRKSLQNASVMLSGSLFGNGFPSEIYRCVYRADAFSFYFVASDNYYFKSFHIRWMWLRLLIRENEPNGFWVYETKKREKKDYGQWATLVNTRVPETYNRSYFEVICPFETAKNYSCHRWWAQKDWSLKKC